MPNPEFDPEKELRKMASECIEEFLSDGSGFFNKVGLDEEGILKEYCGMPYAEPINCCCMQGKVISNPEKPGWKTFECRLLDLAAYVRNLLKQGYSVETINESILKFKDDLLKGVKETLGH